ncbi:hypothetical protein PY32053_00651 [Paracoccus yeei]|uniref:Uncharacterized protein n=1 Tax=Paracoccus yeei TaxID=147645 RepID=A0A386UIZ0_9RHOB|nr:hypothetical protein PY32053_00651 [Paracoccus yeei]
MLITHPEGRGNLCPPATMFTGCSYLGAFASNCKIARDSRPRAGPAFPASAAGVKKRFTALRRGFIPMPLATTDGWPAAC